jgi:hypothetical protein
MKSKNMTSAARVLPLLLSISAVCALAQERRPAHFSGSINDYTPATVKGGPWEMHGQWSVDLHGDWDRADFSAAMTMSDYGTTASGAVDPTQGGQTPHTHQIALTNAKVTWNMDGCPVFKTPVPLQGFQINGPVSLLTGNGSNAPFETTPPSSVMQICITGGDNIPYSVVSSNITLVFTGPATSHFGTQAIHGVVRDVSFAPFDIDTRHR